MFYGDGLFLSSDNEKLQPHKPLPAGPQGAVRSARAVHVCAGVCVCALPLDLDAFIHLPSSFKCVATEEGEWFVYNTDIFFKFLV